MTGALKTWQIRLINLAWILVGIILVIEFIIDVQRAGDFQGYINAGQLVLNGDYIYSDYLNTWPPLFSIFSIPLTLIHNISPPLVRILWQAGSLIAMWYVVSISVRAITRKSLSFYLNPGELHFRELLVTIPVLLSLRYIMDNMANLQINMYLLLLCILAIREYTKGRLWLSGLLLAFGISMKIYPVFLFFFFLYKREFRLVAWSIFFLIVFNSITMMVFGWEEGLSLYQRWQEDVTPRSFIANHKNQSYFGVLLRLFTDMDPDHGLYTNFVALDPGRVKKYTYLFISFIALIPAYLLRRKIAVRTSIGALLEYSFVLTAIPLLTPIAWKAYFIFLWPAIFTIYNLLYRSDFRFRLTSLKAYQVTFWFGVVLVLGPSEIFVGPGISDVLEAYSLISTGTSLLLILILLLRLRMGSTEQVSFKTDFSQAARRDSRDQ